MAILLATFNGSRFLDEQLASIAGQDWPLIDVWASDDGSDDATPALLDRWTSAWPKGTFDVAMGPGRGFAENFRALLARPRGEADYYAFADQDDIWDADKLSRAVAMLREFSPARPALYCSRTRIVDEAGLPIGMSPLFRRQPDFRNALVQSLAGGNTMVMNKAAYAVLSEAARRTGFVSHDWWAYLLISGVDGIVVYDAQPHLAYRQHGANLVGTNTGVLARINRIRRIFAGQLAGWNATNLAGLDRCADLLSDGNRQILREFRLVKGATISERLRGIARSRVYRQTYLQSLTLWLAAVAHQL